MPDGQNYASFSAGAPWPNYSLDSCWDAATQSYKVGSIILLRAVLVVMANPAPEISRGLDPDVTEPLAVLALREAGLDFVYFDLYTNVMK